MLKQFTRQKIESELSLFDKTNDPPHIQWPTLDADFRLFPSLFSTNDHKGICYICFHFLTFDVNIYEPCIELNNLMDGRKD